MFHNMFVHESGLRTGTGHPKVHHSGHGRHGDWAGLAQAQPPRIHALARKKTCVRGLDCSVVLYRYVESD